MWSPKRKLMFSKKRVNQNKERLRKITKTHPLRFVKPKLIHKHGKKNHKESPTLSLHLEPSHFFWEPRDIVTPHPTTRGHPMDDGWWRLVNLAMAANVPNEVEVEVAKVGVEVGEVFFSHSGPCSSPTWMDRFLYWKKGCLTKLFRKKGSRHLKTKAENSGVTVRVTCRFSGFGVGSCKVNWTSFFGEQQGQERRPKYVISVSACTDSDNGSEEEWRARCYNRCWRMAVEIFWNLGKLYRPNGRFGHPKWSFSNRIPAKCL